MVDTYENMKCDDSLCDNLCCINNRCGYSYFECNSTMLTYTLGLAGFLTFVALAILCWKLNCCNFRYYNNMTLPQDDTTKPIENLSMSKDDLKPIVPIITPDCRTRSQESYEKGAPRSKTNSIIANNRSENDEKASVKSRQSFKDSQEMVNIQGPLQNNAEDENNEGRQEEIQRNDENNLDDSSKKIQIRNFENEEIKITRPKSKNAIEAIKEVDENNTNEIHVNPISSRKSVRTYVPEETFPSASPSKSQRKNSPYINPF